VKSRTTIDVSKLQRIRFSNTKIIARCPACAELGRDRKGNNLAIFPNGAFHCQAFPGDREHNLRIVSISGAQQRHLHSDWERNYWSRKAEKAKRAEREANELIKAVENQRSRIVADYRWNPQEIREDSPQPMRGGVEYDPRHFIASSFSASDLIWTGNVFQSGIAHADRWRRVSDWRTEEPNRVGPMISPAVWLPGTCSRSQDRVRHKPYTVLDFDGIDGARPQTQEDLRQHVLASLAIVRWLRISLQWDLHAIIWTGNKSIHAWFKTPPLEVLRSLKSTANAFGIDAGLLGHPEHPCRLPGHPHPKTGKLSRIIWLQKSNITINL
jgi:hypothetical protein